MGRRRTATAPSPQEATAALSQGELCHPNAAHTSKPHLANHIWAIDFVHDKLSNGRPYKMLTMLDEYTREALCAAVRPKLNANDGLDVLHRLLMKNGKTSPDRHQCLLRLYNKIRPHHARNMPPPTPKTIPEKPQITGTETGG
jgi:transposase InsO family protein